MRAEESRVLVVAPLGPDAQAITAMLRQEGIMAEACAGAGECLERLEAGAGAVVLTEEALELPGAEELLESFGRQPSWSELPLIILTRGGESRFERLLAIAADVAGAVTLLERPMRAGTLLQTVRVALRSRRRQYEVRDLLAERERREGVLRESEAKLRAVIEEAPLAIVLTGPSGEILFRNPRFDQLWGRPPHVTTARTYSEVYEGYHLDGRPIKSDEWPAARALLKGERVENDVCEIVQAGGQRITCWFGAVPIRSTSGEIVGTVCVFRDITRERRTEEALRQSEEKYRALFETIDQGFCTIEVLFDPHQQPVDFRFLMVNPAFEKQTGIYNAAGRRVRQIAPLLEEHWFQIYGRIALTGEPRRFENVAKELHRHFEVNAWRVGEPTQRRVAILFNDITERKRVEETLRELHQRLEYHIQNTPLAVVEFDAEMRVSLWSEGAERLFGWKAAEVLGRPMRDIPWICQEDREKVERVSAGLESGRTARSVSPNRNVRKDGKVIWCEWYNSSLTDNSGKLQSIQSLVLDVTARKQAEAVLARDKEELERLVAERTAALRELVGELEHFSYSITHDMRAPLRAMMGFAEVVKELCSEHGSEQQKVFLERIQTAARRMDLLITDALNYSKAIRSELPLAPMDVRRLLREMVDTYPELQGSQGGIRIEPELPLVMGNEAGLTQCFSNLLVNAVKFVKPGERPQVRVWAEVLADHEGWVRIWVEDQGIGISKRMLPRVFDMFSRGTSAQAGTGIGLALVRKVVERMGGQVGVESEEGRGSRFWVELRSGDFRRTAATGREVRPMTSEGA